MTSAPQVGPMKDDATSVCGTSYAWASAVVTCFVSRCGELVGLDSHAAVADDRDPGYRLGDDLRDSVDGGLLLRALDARDLELRSAAELDPEVEPALRTGISTEMIMATMAMVNQILRCAMKSKERSPV